MYQLFNILAQKIDSIDKYSKRGEKGDKWSEDHAELQLECLHKIEEKYFPSRSENFIGTYLDIPNSNKNRLIIHCCYQCGEITYVYYEIIITPSLLQNFTFRVNWKGYKGKYKKELLDTFQDIWTDILLKEVPLSDVSVPLH